MQGTLYRVLLDAHSYWRWVLLLVGVVAFAQSVSTAQKGQAWSATNERWAKLFLAAVDLQLLLGLVLWLGLSPFWKALLANPHASMQNGVVRFWSVEHETSMILAVVVAHVGRVMSKRRAPEKRARTFAIAVGIWLALVLIGFPWPGLPYARLLLRAP